MIQFLKAGRFGSVVIGLAVLASGTDAVGQAPQGKVTSLRQVQGRVRCVATSPDGTLLVAAGGPWRGCGPFWAFLADARNYQTRFEFTPSEDTSDVTCVSFSPDSRQLALGTDSGFLFVYDTRSGKLVTTFRSHDASVTYIAFAAKTNKIVTGGSDHVVIVRDLSKPEQKLTTIQLDEEWLVRGGISSDGKRLYLTGGDYSIKIIDLLSGMTLVTRRTKESCQSLAVSPDQATIAVGFWDGTVAILDPNTLRTITELTAFRGIDPGVISIGFSADGKSLLTGGFGGVAKAWDVQSWKPRFTSEEHWGPIKALTMSGDILVTASDRERNVRFWDLKNSKEILLSLNEFRAIAHALAVAPNGQVLATGGCAFGLNGPAEVILWDLKTGERLAQTKRHGLTNQEVDSMITNTSSLVNGLTFSDNSKFVASAEPSGRIRVLDVPSLREVFSVTESATRFPRLVFSPDSRNLCACLNPDAGQRQATIKVWSIADRREIFSLTEDGDRYSAGFSPTNANLLLATRGLVSTVDLKRKQIVNRTPFKEMMNAELVGASKIMLINKGGLALHELPSFDLVAQIHAAKSPFDRVLVAPTGKKMATVDQAGKLVCWELPSGKAIGPMREASSVSALAFAPDGETLFIADERRFTVQPVRVVPKE